MVRRQFVPNDVPAHYTERQEPGMTSPSTITERVAEVRRVVDDELTGHQRRVFVAVVVDGIPPDALAARLGLECNVIYNKVIFLTRDVRSAGRWSLTGTWEEPGLEQ
jgi:hypothetical protein